jgi:hypothetical protein
MDTKPKKVNKYLTDLKELSVEIKDDPKDSKQEFKPKVQEVIEDQKPKVKPEIKAENTVQRMETTSLKSSPTDSDPVSGEAEELIERRYTSKDVILAVINLLSVIFLIFLLIKLPEEAEELRNLRIDSIKDSQGGSVGISNSEDSISKSAELQSLFLDDFGVVNFTVDIEKLKVENPVIKKVSFTSQKPVKDRLGFSGVPAVIVLEGNWESIGRAMEAIESLPYLFRPVDMKSEASSDNPNVIVLNYGGLLYVGDKFTKN